MNKPEQPLFCPTASGTMIIDGKILLVHHKKLNFWLAPGGHVEENELPHQAAEREFWEETGIKVKALSAIASPDAVNDSTKFHPVPFSANLHWISRKNFEARTQGAKRSKATQKNWGRGCEKHFDYRFFVMPKDWNLQKLTTASLDEAPKFEQNLEESLGIGWFGEDEIDALETHEMIKSEIHHAFLVYNTFLIESN